MADVYLKQLVENDDSRSLPFDEVMQNPMFARHILVENFPLRQDAEQIDWAIGDDPRLLSNFQIFKNIWNGLVAQHNLKKIKRAVYRSTFRREHPVFQWLLKQPNALNMSMAEIMRDCPELSARLHTAFPDLHNKSVRVGGGMVKINGALERRAADSRTRLGNFWAEFRRENQAIRRDEARDEQQPLELRVISFVDNKGKSVQVHGKIVQVRDKKTDTTRDCKHCVKCGGIEGCFVHKKWAHKLGL